MSDGTGISWTDATWNPVVGCTRVNAGCDNCYAKDMSHRLEEMGLAKYAGLTVLNNRGDRHFNGVVRTVPEALKIPLRWRKPRKVFVNSMSDLFHRDVPFEFIIRVYAVMALCPHLTFQILTKRPQRAAGDFVDEAAVRAAIYEEVLKISLPTKPKRPPWPLPNVWLGCSVSDQKTADEAIPDLLRCPAVVQFVSYEPALGPVDFSAFLACGPETGRPGLDWVIVGGESGPDARLFDPSWALSAVTQCREAGVACFVKQLGAKPIGGIRLKSRHGSDPSEWPDELRVQEFPQNYQSDGHG